MTEWGSSFEYGFDLVSAVSTATSERMGGERAREGKDQVGYRGTERGGRKERRRGKRVLVGKASKKRKKKVKTTQRRRSMENRGFRRFRLQV